MPRVFPPTVHQVYIADGFADDCDELIHRCSRVDILSYQTFCIYYKDMNFASVFKGRTSNSEIAELSEELLQIAKYYMVLDTSNFEESVAGLFLVYALLNLQPYTGFAHLRIVPEDLPAIARIEQVARRERRLDVLYVLGSVLTKGPVQYHAAGRERGMEGPIRKYLEGSCTVDATGVRPKGVYFRQNEELDIIREMTGIFKRYSKAKEQIPGLKNRGLSYCNNNLAEDLGTSLKRLINGITETEAEPQSEDHYSSVQEIKDRAMRGAVSTVRHLNAADQRSPEKTPRPPITPNTTPKPPPSPSATKRKTKPKKAKKVKRRRHSLSSTSSEDSEDSDDWCKKKTSPASATFASTEAEDSKLNEQEINVEIDALPNLITTESDGKLVEIEIIDKMKGKRGRPKKDASEKDSEKGKETKDDKKGRTKKDSDAKKDLKGGKGIDKSQAKKKEAKELEAKKVEAKKKDAEAKKVAEAKKKEAEAKAKNDDVIFKKPLRMSPRLRKVAKREQKKPILKSKFKKMGMLPIANFEEQK